MMKHSDEAKAGPMIHTIKRIQERKLLWEDLFAKLSTVPDENPGIDLNLEIKLNEKSSFDQSESNSEDCTEENQSYHVFGEESVPQDIPAYLQTVLQNKTVKEFFDKQEGIDLEKYNAMMLLYINKHANVIESEDIVTAYAKYFRWQIIVYSFLTDNKVQRLNKMYNKKFKETFQNLYKTMKRKDLFNTYIKFITYEYEILKILVYK